MLRIVYDRELQASCLSVDMLYDCLLSSFCFVDFTSVVCEQKQHLLQRVVVLDDHPGKAWLQPFYRCVTTVIYAHPPISASICVYLSFFQGAVSIRL